VELNEEMQRYTDADKNYYITANTVLNLAKKNLWNLSKFWSGRKKATSQFLTSEPAVKGRKANV